MTNEQIQALAREYAEEIYPNLSDKIISRRTQEIKEAERVIRFLLRRFCLVEKSRLKKLDIAYRAKAYDIVVLNKRDVDYIFPEIGKEVEG